jgi:hypothetical protein
MEGSMSQNIFKNNFQFTVLFYLFIFAIIFEMWRSRYAAKSLTIYGDVGFISASIDNYPILFANIKFNSNV